MTTLTYDETSNCFLAQIRCPEYTLDLKIKIRESVAVENLFILLRNIRRLSHVKAEGLFTLLELLVIARDVDSLKRFVRVGSLRAGRGSKEYRQHVWKLASTEPRILFKQRLPKTSSEFLATLRQCIFTPWSPTSAKYFDLHVNEQMEEKLRVLSELLPPELSERVLKFLAI